MESPLLSRRLRLLIHSRTDPGKMKRGESSNRAVQEPRENTETSGSWSSKAGLQHRGRELAYHVQSPGFYSKDAVQGGGPTATAPAATPKHSVALGVPLTFMASFTCCLHPGDTQPIVNNTTHSEPEATCKDKRRPLLLSPGKWSLGPWS